ncbi:elongation factor P maturation arginine rhamnosyltransferase EarP [Parasedimentitalea maritima]|uniref:Elongation factor P maturation arginine rhamnosyltransferase EarP n=1 Tax=Parasedimentitalea maritima TaxID=2578117 RepID=A0ABY2UPX3_9RHOB|nr:elongation factor P maturation arginine rhamnosyltransferase EarP [Zongyanglinia marina]TLP56494.1 elongation factor P maturation arginine rhamnosyltransferase EarP [Zongyanglinia marina]
MKTVICLFVRENILEDSASPMVLITDVNAVKWRKLCEDSLVENEMGFRADLRFVDAQRFVGSDEETLREAFPYPEAVVIFAVDELTLSQEGRPVLCIDPEGQAASFRAHLNEIWQVESNLSTGNLLFEEIVEECVEDGYLKPLDEF